MRVDENLLTSLHSETVSSFALDGVVGSFLLSLDQRKSCLPMVIQLFSVYMRDLRNLYNWLVHYTPPV